MGQAASYVACILGSAIVTSAGSMGAELPASGPFVVPSDSICPPEFLALARGGDPKPMAFVRATGAATLETARDALAAGLALPVLVGEGNQIRSSADALGWDLDGATIIDAEGEKGAIETAIALVQNGQAHGLIKGQLHTDVFMGGIVRRTAGIRTDKRLVHVFAMLPRGGGRPLLISDAAVNIAPDVTTRVESALAMSSILRKMGVQSPRIAVLSATESRLEAMPSSIEAEEIASLASKADSKAAYAGPLSLDLAISPESVAIKGIDPNSPQGAVAGQADGLVVPDIVSGNVLFKALAYCAGGLAAGLVVGGSVPIMLTSRSDPPAARLASIALAAIAGQEEV